MTINAVSHESGPQMDELSYVDLAKQELQLRTEFLIERMQETYHVIFGNEIPNPEYYERLKERIAVINEKFSFDILLDESESQVKFYVEDYTKELNQLTQDEWPLAYQYAKDQFKKINKRVVFANIEFRDFFDSEDISAFKGYEKRISEALADAKSNLLKQSSAEERNVQTKKLLENIRSVREDVELHIARFSIPNAKEKILNRIQDIFNEFEDLDLSEERKKVEMIEGETKNLLFDKDKKEQMQVIASQLDRLQEVDTEIEKKYFVRLIQHEYEEFIRVVTKLQVDGPSLSDEMCYAKDRMEGSKERIEGMGMEFSPTSLNIPSQLQITKKGTLNTFAHTLKEAYIKYGAHTIESTIQLLPFCARLGGHEGIGAEEKRALALHHEMLVEKAKKDLTWGDDHHSSKVPPILPEEKIEKIIDKHLELASKSIYLAYAEQRIRKYLKFWMLRKSFEGDSEKQKKLIEEQTEVLIIEAKRDLLAYLAEHSPPRVSISAKDAKVSGEFTVNEYKVESIITEHIEKLHSICKG